MKVLVHVEQYDVVGILPSQLESLTLLNKAMGVKKAAYIDNTLDGIKRSQEFNRYGSLEEFFSKESGPYVVLSPTEGEDIRDLKVHPNSWLIFGPAMGFEKEDFKDISFRWARVPGGELNSRDAVPIVLWETSKWQEQ